MKNKLVGTVETIRLTDGEPDMDTWLALEENTIFFDDNGQYPAGNAWLPYEPLTENDEGVEKLLQNGEAEIVKVRYYEGFEDINEAFYLRKLTTPRHFAEINGYQGGEGEDEAVEEAAEAAEAYTEKGKVWWAYYRSNQTLVITW